MNVLGYFVCYVYLFAVIFGVGMLQKIFQFSIETSRKIIHTLIVFTWIFLYHFLERLADCNCPNNVYHNQCTVI